MNNKLDITLLTENPSETEFYPTPDVIIDKMLNEVDLSKIDTILEPSAGDGAIAKYIMKKYETQNSYRSGHLNVDMIEIDPQLRQILKYNISKDNLEDAFVVFDDFLKFNPYKKYDLIIMNPPFSNGDEHLLKAIEIQRKGGCVICLLNAETIKNPYTQRRKMLVDELNKYNAKIEYIKDAFAQAERKTNVEIALIKVFIEQEQEESNIFNHFKKAETVEWDVEADTDLEVSDYIKAITTRYRVEVQSGIKLIKEYTNLMKYCLPTKGYCDYNLKLSVGDKQNCTINRYLEYTRLKYWETLLDNPKFTCKLTSNLQEKYRKMVYELKNYEFDEFNIKNLVIEMNANVIKGIEETILSLFETLSCDHTYYPECKNNTHYYNGWKTNKAHKVNKKVIIPCWGVFDDAKWGGNFKPYRAKSVIEDIEKCFNFLDGGLAGNLDIDVDADLEFDLGRVLDEAHEKKTYKNIEFKYFKCNFYKKGTVHISFTNMGLLDKFNIFVSQKRNWLPPNYGKVNYNDMSTEEKSVVEEFQGEADYKKIMNNRGYYLISDGIKLIDK